MKPLVFVPLSADELRALVASGTADVTEAYAADPALYRAYGFDPAEDEEAEHTAQVLASLACVRRGLPRLVVTAEIDRLPEPGERPGVVRLTRLAWRDATSLFVDDPEDLPDDATLAQAADGELSALDPYPLLWFAPSEAGPVLDLLGD
ncbi:hypothetical protein GCM10027418_00770 [Mariniluteicoccus endophyticus]